MKIIIIMIAIGLLTLKAFASMVCGLLGEIFYRGEIPGRKIFWMLPLYFVFGYMMLLVYMIPIFKMVVWAPAYMLIGGITATLLELAFGLLLNKVLKLNVWHYEEAYIKILFMRIPTFHQIKLKHSLIYMPLSLIVIYMDEAVNMLTNVVAYFTR